MVLLESFGILEGSMKTIRGCLYLLICSGLSSSAIAGTIATAAASWTGQVCSGLWDNPVPGCNGTITPVGGSTSGTGTTGAGAGLSFPSSLQPYVLGGGVADATVKLWLRFRICEREYRCYWRWT
jgi:hypothetical protein